MSEGRRRPGERAGLDVESVLGEARAILEREGLDRLTMRNLADRLGVAPNALYSHFADKEELLDVLMDSLLADVEIPPLDTGRDGLIQLMRSSRRFLLSHTELLPRFLTHPRRGPNAIRLGEATLTLLANTGLQGREAADALRILLVYTFGFVAQEAPRRLDPEADLRRTRSEEAFRAAREHPRMRELAGPLAEDPSEATFEKGLGWLLDGILKRGRA